MLNQLTAGCLDREYYICATIGNANFSYNAVATKVALLEDPNLIMGRSLTPNADRSVMRAPGKKNGSFAGSALGKTSL